MVDPRIVMQPNVGSDRSWVWTAYDYAEGDLQEEVFALKFGKPQDAEEFKTAFDEAKKAMKAFVAGKSYFYFLPSIFFPPLFNCCFRKKLICFVLIVIF